MISNDVKQKKKTNQKNEMFKHETDLFFFKYYYPLYQGAFEPTNPT